MENTELASFYVFLYERNEERLAKALLLDECFFDVQNIRREDAINEKAVFDRIKEALGPAGPMLEESKTYSRREVIQCYMSDYRESYLVGYVMCLIKQESVKSNYNSAILIADWQIKHIEQAGTFSGLYLKSCIHDIIKIVTLRVCTRINELFIELAQAPHSVDIL